ncbi:hypothetical protein K443DRAFT_676323 [Laccaria amethystina LaAM-08-1]|uniref:Uncharacterized protein n=1 Tax=Laccaria amethystina LaAM-08-1 TaxID=1095629 RepID=A0A0C9XQV3_9AGAR|nr:hypothetical protein K443DRAFT_676323 [Laccaria amethystina LaAM-08-1]
MLDQDPENRLSAPGRTTPKRVQPQRRSDAAEKTGADLGLTLEARVRRRGQKR